MLTIILDAEVADYELLNQAATRPWSSAFLCGSAESYRWFEDNGKARIEPLTKEELTEEIGSDRTQFESNAIPINHWNWFKNKKLGLLRTPIELLQKIILEHANDADWWVPARNAVDWCATPKQPRAEVIYDALNGLVFRANNNAKINGEKLPPWHTDIVLARNTVGATFFSEIESRSSDICMMDAYSQLNELHHLYLEAKLSGNNEQAAFERSQAIQIEQLFPVLKELIKFVVIEESAIALDNNPSL